jgi:hypothetical protein
MVDFSIGILVLGIISIFIVSTMKKYKQGIYNPQHPEKKFQNILLVLISTN